MTLYTCFVDNLRAAIAANGTTMTALARHSGYSASYLSRVLNGTMQNPTLQFVECMAKALDTTPLSLLTLQKP